MLSDSPPERDLEWTEAGVTGAWRFQQRLHRIGVARQLPGPECLDDLAIGADRGDVDVAVEHGAGHQADGPAGLILCSQHGRGLYQRRSPCLAKTRRDDDAAPPLAALDDAQ